MLKFFPQDTFLSTAQALCWSLACWGALLLVLQLWPQLTFVRVDVLEVGTFPLIGEALGGLQPFPKHNLVKALRAAPLLLDWCAALP